jgi:hypothetical protein
MPGVGYLALIAIFDFIGPVFNGQLLPVGNYHSLVRVNFNVANNPGLVGQTTTIQFQNNISPAPPPGNPVPPPTTNLAVTDTSAGIAPIQENGIVQIVSTSPTFKRGLANSDGTVDLADAIFLLSYLFSGGAAPLCFDAADITDDGGIDISDAIRLINFLFADGPPPEHPYPGCGVDLTVDAFPACPTSLGNCP